jgi:hypothetical protein
MSMIGTLSHALGLDGIALALPALMSAHRPGGNTLSRPAALAAAALLLMLLLLLAAFMVPPAAKCTSAERSLPSCLWLLVAAASGF